MIAYLKNLVNKSASWLASLRIEDTPHTRYLEEVKPANDWPCDIHAYVPKGVEAAKSPYPYHEVRDILSRPPKSEPGLYMAKEEHEKIDKHVKDNGICKVTTQDSTPPKSETINWIEIIGSEGIIHDLELKTECMPKIGYTNGGNTMQIFLQVTGLLHKDIKTDSAEDESNVEPLPEPSLSRIVTEDEDGEMCLLCGSSIKFVKYATGMMTLKDKAVGCIHPKCSNYYKKKL